MLNKIDMRNRREWPRVNRQVSVRGEGSVVGVTLNVSERGARVVMRQDLPSEFDLTLEVGVPIQVRAETVWEQKLTGGGSVRGVRFVPGESERNVLAGWLLGAQG